MLCRKLKLYLSYLQIKLLSLIRAMVFKISGADGAKMWNFQLLNRCSDQRMSEVWPPQKWGLWCHKRFWSPKNIKGGPQKWNKTVFLKKGPSYILPKIIYGISEPHGDLLHWNLSWASTFNFLVHKERGVKYCRHYTTYWYCTPFRHVTS